MLDSPDHSTDLSKFFRLNGVLLNSKTSKKGEKKAKNVTI
jgi:hypothetical protein